MNRRRFIAALGTLGVARSLPAQKGPPPSRDEFICVSDLQRGVVPNLVAAKVRVGGPEERAGAQGFLQYVSEPAEFVEACRLLDRDLLYQRWSPHLISSGDLPLPEELVTDPNRLRFELGFQSLPVEKECVWRKGVGLGVTVNELKLFLPAVLVDPEVPGPFFFVVAAQGNVLETMKADSRTVNFAEGRVDGLREFFWWQKAGAATHALLERLAAHSRLDVSLCNHQMAPLLSFHLNLESLPVVKRWLVDSVEYMARNHRKRECRPLDLHSDCFLTTATVGALGLSDDCWELQSLRRFRDRTLLATAAGRALVAEYYKIAPEIVRRVNQHPNARSIWRRVYFSGILPSAVLARLRLNRVAILLYKRMTRRLVRLTA